jgi:WhiB family transcriptional regulator, redox-sensing transcriptional regulator
VEFFQLPAWIQQGDCPCGDIVDPDTVFFPIRGGSSKTARAVCAACSERINCLTWALANSEVLGIWGGTSDRERRTLRRHKAEVMKGARPDTS